MERVSLVYKWKEDACCLLTQAQHVQWVEIRNKKRTWEQKRAGRRKSRQMIKGKCLWSKESKVAFFLMLSFSFSKALTTGLLKLVIFHWNTSVEFIGYNFNDDYSLTTKIGLRYSILCIYWLEYKSISSETTTNGKSSVLL